VLATARNGATQNAQISSQRRIVVGDACVRIDVAAVG
jgi:hypothetical protein